MGGVLIAENSVESPCPCRYKLGSVEVVAGIGASRASWGEYIYVSLPFPTAHREEAQNGDGGWDLVWTGTW